MVLLTLGCLTLGCLTLGCLTLGCLDVVTLQKMLTNMVLWDIETMVC